MRNNYIKIKRLLSQWNFNPFLARFFSIPLQKLKSSKLVFDFSPRFLKALQATI